MRILSLIFVFLAGPAIAGPLPESLLATVAGASVVIVGEVHDNPAHHEAQAKLVQQIAPRAIVFEMLTTAQAVLVTQDNRADQALLETALGWADSGWPDFAMYYPIFAAAPDALIYGAAVPRDDARAAMEDEIAATFGPDARAYGLLGPLPTDQLATRIALQDEVHCNAMPPEMLPTMVDIQRLRDATLARAVAQAMRDTRGAVVVITGNGHARKDWGMPSILAEVMPDARIFVLGQTEDDAAMDGVFDLILSAAPVARPDPCDALR